VPAVVDHQVEAAELAEGFAADAVEQLGVGLIAHVRPCAGAVLFQGLLDLELLVLAAADIDAIDGGRRHDVEQRVKRFAAALADLQNGNLIACDAAENLGIDRAELAHLGAVVLDELS
jgi:hypothetical protein